MQGVSRFFMQQTGHGFHCRMHGTTSRGTPGHLLNVAFFPVPNPGIRQAVEYYVPRLIRRGLSRGEKFFKKKRKVGVCAYRESMLMLPNSCLISPISFAPKAVCTAAISSWAATSHM